MTSGIEAIARNAIKAFLVSKGTEIVSGMTSNGRPVDEPTVTTSPGTPPIDSGPFVTVYVSGTDISLGGSPVSVTNSHLKVNIILRDYIEPEIGDDQSYEIAYDNHTDIGDRIKAELLKKFKADRVISDVGTGFDFKIDAEAGMQKINSGASTWDGTGYYVVEISQLTFVIRSHCGETLF